MPNLVPDSEGQRHDYVVEAKVTFSMVTERNAPASFMTKEENAAALASAMEDYLRGSVIALVSDDYTVTATATATPREV